MNKIENISAVGRRKSAVARVILTPGHGKIVCDYVFTKKSDTDEIMQLFDLIGLASKYNVKLFLTGGGYHSRIDAAKLAVARALVKLDESNKKTLREAGYITRDPREKERKKPGLRRARRAPQWAKR